MALQYSITHVTNFYKTIYPQGTVIELLEPIDDLYTPKPIGARFCVTDIDDSMQMHGRWADGGSMAVVIGVDSFRVVHEE